MAATRRPERRTTTRPRGGNHQVSIYRTEYAEEMVAYCAEGHSLTGFAGKIGVHRQTLADWGKRYPEFGEALGSAKAKRTLWWEERAKEFMGKGGSGGQANLIMFALRSASPDDWMQKEHVEHSGTLSLEKLLMQVHEAPKAAAEKKPK